MPTVVRPPEGREPTVEMFPGIEVSSVRCSVDMLPHELCFLMHISFCMFIFAILCLKLSSRLLSWILLEKYKAHPRLLYLLLVCCTVTL